MIHVALGLTDTTGSYYKRALTTALSVLDNTKSAVHIHLIHDETLREEAKNHFLSVVSQYGQTISFYSAEAIASETTGNVPLVITKGALYKILLPRLLPVEKIIYLDCDVICLADMEKLFAFDVSSNYIGAVRKSPHTAKAWIKKFGLTCGFCVNSGVLLMNLDKIRKDCPDYEQRMFTLIANNPFKIADQEALNLLFDKVPDAFLFLPQWCNLLTEEYDNSAWPLPRYYGKVIHYAGKKPWEVFTHPALFYWKYHSRLFPADDAFAMIEKLAPYEYAPLFSWILRDDSRRRWARRWRQFSENGLFRTLWAKLR